MELHEIDVYIDLDGEVRVEVRGVKGTSCLAATLGLEKALGGELVRREMTPEANETGGGQVRESQWGQAGS